MKSKQEILKECQLELIKRPEDKILVSESFEQAINTSGFDAILKSMDEYAKELAIDFCLNIVGQLKVNSDNKTSYSEDSNEAMLLLLPATIHKRFELYLKSKQ